MQKPSSLVVVIGGHKDTKKPEKPSKQTALVCPKTAPKYDIRATELSALVNFCVGSTFNL